LERYPKELAQVSQRKNSVILRESQYFLVFAFLRKFSQFWNESKNEKNMGAIIPILRIAGQFAAGWFVNDVASFFGRIAGNFGINTKDDQQKPNIFLIVLAAIALGALYLFLFPSKKR
jgi:hypothetical protein